MTGSEAARSPQGRRVLENEFTCLWRAVEAAPRDAAPKLVLVDWLEESGRDPDLAAGLRWAAEYDWWPRPSSSGDFWVTDVRCAKRWGGEEFIMAVCWAGRGWGDGKRVCGCSAADARMAVGHVGRALRRADGQKVSPPG